MRRTFSILFLDCLLVVLSENYPSHFTCSEKVSCVNTGDNLLEIFPSITTEEECQVKCYSIPDCEVYTWYGSQSHPFHLDCFLYHSCEIKEECTGCWSGPKECPTTATSSVTSTTSLFCSSPTNPPNGYWFCSTSMLSSPQNNYMICDLECNPGYASDSRTRTICSHGAWNHNPSSLTCSPALALITGGDDFYISAELYGEGVHTMQPNMPEARESHTLDYVDGHIVLCGDFYNNAEKSCLELKSTMWFQHSTLIYPRKGHSSVVLRSTLHLLGGHASKRTSEYNEPVDNLDDNIWKQGEFLMEDVWYSCAAKISPHAFILTGGMGSPNSAFQYNLTSGYTARLADMKHRRYAHGCVHVKDEENSGKVGVVVAGGAMNENKLTTTEVYSLEEGVWSELGHLNIGREGVRLVMIQANKVLAFGGGPGGYEKLRTVESLDLTSGLWTLTEDMLEPRKYHAITAVPSTRFSNRNSTFL